MLAPLTSSFMPGAARAPNFYAPPGVIFRQMSERRDVQVSMMFCPQCGQQSSDEVRFCPRCGLSLMPHAALLAGYDSAAAGRGAAQAAEQTSKRAGTRRGAKLMFFSVVLFPVFFALCFLVDGPAPLVVPITFFLTGLVWLVYARLFGDDLVHVHRGASRGELQPGAGRTALGAPQFVPASLFNQQRANTAEIVPPPSVTENTTTLLDKDS
jgi:ribosomal protein S27AE